MKVYHSLLHRQLGHQSISSIPSVDEMVNEDVALPNEESSNLEETQRYRKNDNTIDLYTKLYRIREYVGSTGRPFSTSPPSSGQLYARSWT
jgi:hypothetical protein